MSKESKTCGYCDRSYDYIKGVSGERFCSVSCSQWIVDYCEFCDKKLKPRVKGRKRKYCNTKCQNDNESQAILDKYFAGERTGWTGKTRSLCVWLRRYIYKERGTACSKCGWNEKHPIDGKSLTEINHIDGDAENCALINLEVLCPNCHSMTSNFRARNKTSARNRN